MVKKGDRIIFTKEKYMYPDKFTFGKKYIVIEASLLPSNNKLLLKVMDDSGDVAWINSVYFDDKNVLRELKLKRIIDG